MRSGGKLRRIPLLWRNLRCYRHQHQLRCLWSGVSQRDLLSEWGLCLYRQHHHDVRYRCKYRLLYQRSDLLERAVRDGVNLRRQRTAVLLHRHAVHQRRLLRSGHQYLHGRDLQHRLWQRRRLLPDLPILPDLQQRQLCRGRVSRQERVLHRDRCARELCRRGLLHR